MGGGSGGSRPVSATNAGTGSYNATLNDYVDKSRENEKKRVFISFHHEDRGSVELLREQVRNENYDLEFVDTSLKNPVKERNWKGPVGTKIKQSDAVICMVGKDTHSRPAVSWEVQQAYDNDVPVIPVRIHGDKKYHRPEPIQREGDETIPWKINKIQYTIDKVTYDE